MRKGSASLTRSLKISENLGVFSSCTPLINDWTLMKRFLSGSVSFDYRLCRPAHCNLGVYRMFSRMPCHCACCIGCARLVRACSLSISKFFPRKPKMKCVASIKSLVIVFTVVAVVISTAAAQTEKVDGAIDVVVILSMTHDFQDAFLSMSVQNASLEFFQNHFEFDGSKTRLALVDIYNSNTTGHTLITEKVVLNLTSDVALINQALVNWKPVIYEVIDVSSTEYIDMYSWNLYFALRAINEIIFANDDPLRAKVVIIGLSLGGQDMLRRQQAIDTSQKLCDRGVYMYVMAAEIPRNESGSTHRSGMNHAPLLICFEENLFVIPDDTTESIKDGLIRFKLKMARDLCGWRSMCHFINDSSGSCEPAVWKTAESYIKPEQCGKIKPAFTCAPDDCSKTCDNKWPWAHPPPNCNLSPCGTSVSRGGKFVAVDSNEMMEKLRKHCPHTIACPPCPPPVTEDPVERNLSRRAVEETVEKAKQQNKTTIAIIGGLIGVLVMLSILSLIVLLICLKKRKAEKKVNDQKMDAVLEVASLMVSHMAVNVPKMPGADSQAVADLSERESKPSEPKKRLPKKPTNLTKSKASGKK